MCGTETLSVPESGGKTSKGRQTLASICIYNYPLRNPLTKTSLDVLMDFGCSSNLTGQALHPPKQLPCLQTEKDNLNHLQHFDPLRSSPYHRSSSPSSASTSDLRHVLIHRLLESGHIHSAPSSRLCPEWTLGFRSRCLIRGISLVNVWIMLKLRPTHHLGLLHHQLARCFGADAFLPCRCLGSRETRTESKTWF